MRVLQSLDREEIARLRERNEFFWLDLVAPSDDDLTQLGELFGLHPLAVEDSIKFNQRPKLDDYADHILLVFYGVHDDGNGAEATPVEVHIFISGHSVITVHRDPCGPLTDVRDRLERGPKWREGYVVYRILDALTDSFFPFLSKMDDEIDALEDAMVEHPTDEQLHRIFHLKRSLVTLRRVVAPQRDLLASGGDLISRLPGLDVDKAHDYFRDVYDHLIRISEQIDSYRDLLTGALDVYLSTVSNRMNVVMKQLAVVSTIFLPLAFVTGFFGQNFGWLVGHIDSEADFLTLGIGGLVIPLGLMWAWFRRSGFFD
jgi:magnesium transporter